uniref:Paxillin n=1 Tax=Paramormyrops kingsleyae TaxID=1676925 RepID=A0A3B3T8G6_9TELE
MDDLDALLADLESTTSHISKRPVFLPDETPYSYPTGGHTYQEFHVPPPVPPPPSADALNGTVLEPPGSHRSSVQSVGSAQKSAWSQDSSSPRSHSEEDHVYSFPNKQKGSDSAGAMSSSLGSNLSELDRLLLELNAVQHSAPCFPTEEDAVPPLLSGAPTLYGKENGVSVAAKAPPPTVEKPKRRVVEDVRPSVENLLDQLESSVPRPVPTPSATQSVLDDTQESAAAQQSRISASSATRELDELMASLSDFKVQSNSGSLGPVNAGPLCDMGAGFPHLTLSSFAPTSVMSLPCSPHYLPPWDDPQACAPEVMELRIDEDAHDPRGTAATAVTAPRSSCALCTSASPVALSYTPQFTESAMLIQSAGDNLLTSAFKGSSCVNSSGTFCHPRNSVVRSSEPVDNLVEAAPVAPVSDPYFISVCETSSTPPCLAINSPSSSILPTTPAPKTHSPSFQSIKSVTPAPGTSNLSSTTDLTDTGLPGFAVEGKQSYTTEVPLQYSRTVDSVPKVQGIEGTSAGPGPSLDSMLEDLLEVCFSKARKQEVKENTSPLSMCGGYPISGIAEQGVWGSSIEERGLRDSMNFGSGLTEEGQDGTMTPQTEASWMDDSLTPSPCPQTPDTSLDLPLLQPSAVERMSASGHLKSVIRRTKEIPNVHPMYRDGNQRPKLGPVIFHKSKSQDRLIEELQGKLGIGHIEHRREPLDDWLTEGFVITSNQRSREDCTSVSVDKIIIPPASSVPQRKVFPPPLSPSETSPSLPCPIASGKPKIQLPLNQLPSPHPSSSPPPQLSPAKTLPKVAFPPRESPSQLQPHQAQSPRTPPITAYAHQLQNFPPEPAIPIPPYPLPVQATPQVSAPVPKVLVSVGCQTDDDPLFPPMVQAGVSLSLSLSLSPSPSLSLSLSLSL